MRPLLEVCVDSVTSAKAAIEGGADRLEVCSSLSCGGLTPSNGLLRSIRQLNCSIPLFAMVRPRPGDFCFSELEVEQMLREIEEIKETKLADGFVTGALCPNGSVDVETCEKLLASAESYPVTFHRAFDLTTDAVDALENIIQLGFTRILTSGQCKNAKTGLDVIKMLIQRSNDRIIIMAGCGINDKNLESILREVKIKEIHSSASKNVKSSMEMTHETVTLCHLENDYSWSVCDEKVVLSMASIMKRDVFTLNEPNEDGTSENGSTDASQLDVNDSLTDQVANLTENNGKSGKSPEGDALLETPHPLATTTCLDDATNGHVS